MNATEEWRKIPSLPRYSVSSLGRVRADLSRWPSMDGRILSLSLAGPGYPRCAPGGVTAYVHNLVAEAFIGPKPKGMTVNHKNGDKLDCRPGNIEYVTHADNMLHAASVLGHHRGAANAQCKLTESRVRAIRSATGTQSAIARRYGISQSNVSQIKSGKSWAHLN
jgi:hypothetical protein